MTSFGSKAIHRGAQAGRETYREKIEHEMGNGWKQTAQPPNVGAISVGTKGRPRIEVDLSMLLVSVSVSLAILYIR
jgi:hypothetical protein